MKQTRSLSEFSCLSEYNRLYPNYHLMVIFAKGLDSDQAKQNVSSDFDPKCIPEKILLKKWADDKM